MKDEIKEILENIWFRLYCDSTMSKKYGIELGENECKILLDCITNLQEENTKLKELCDKYEEEHNNAFKLWTMKMEEMPDYEERMNYKSRNEKAIEYINKFESIKAYYEYTDEDGYDEYNYDDDFKKDILNILKGDNK